MPASIEFVEWIVKIALTDEAVSTDELVSMMKKNQLTSESLLNFINDNSFWSVNQPDDFFKVSSQDEKYIIDFKNPNRKHELNSVREKAREAIYTRFYSGHRFNEWII